MKKQYKLVFYDPINELEHPTKVYIHDFVNKNVAAIDVWNHRDLFTGSSYSVFKAPEKVPSYYSASWELFVDEVNNFYTEPLTSDYTVFEFVSDSNIQGQVLQNIHNSWYSHLLITAQALQVIDAVTGVMSNDFFLERLEVTFKGGG